MTPEPSALTYPKNIAHDIYWKYDVILCMSCVLVLQHMTHDVQLVTCSLCNYIVITVLADLFFSL